jgi:transposase
VGARAGAATARRHGISDQQLWQWRKAWREGRLGSVGGLVPVKLVEETGQAGGYGCSNAGRIEIVSANGRRVIVAGAVDVAALVGIVQ